MDNINNEVYNYLSTLGLKHSNNGYRYINAAICLGLEEPERIREIEDLYMDVAAHIPPRQSRLKEVSGTPSRQ